ncbi:hypothetical protein [Pseudoclavibacter helvolus]|uniref:hypothetical protein n=1 Tax=Pseudoclavibacter helvolus TaxID=255205 RepID=UPI003C71C07A
MSFEKVGEKSRRELALDVLRLHSPGDVVAYNELAEALGVDPDDERVVVQAAVRNAAIEFLDVDLHAVEAVQNQGYRIVRADEHVRLAHKLQKRSTRALKRGRKTVQKVDMNGMDPNLRRVVEATGQAFALQIDFNRRMDVRQTNIEKAVVSVAKKQERSDAEIAELQERLARLEKSRES